MTIDFVCPNGHKLKAPEERAGKAGKCPKCGVDFLVPTLEHDEPVEDFTVGPGEVQEEAAGSGKGGAVEAAPPPAAEQPTVVAVKTETAAEPDQIITFLCPKGHKLNSPAKLQGRAGKCPHCGERFRVPMLDELEEPEEEIEEFGVEEEFGGDNFGDATGPVIDAEAYDEEIPEDAVEEDYGPPHPARRLFERLWRERDHGGKVRLLVADGPPIEAHFYARRWSQGEHAVFASRDEAGGYRIAAVAWESVRKIEVDELVNLPDDVFE